MLTCKMYTPARTVPRNPYPHWHKIFAKPYPNWHQIWTEIHTLTGTNPQKGVPFVAQPLEKPYPFWHTFGVQNPTLSGTLLENRTLCGTEVGQNGTLSVLAYMFCPQWECPRVLVLVPEIHVLAHCDFFSGIWPIGISN